MRCISALILASVTLAAADVTIGQWNGMLLVTAPAGGELSRLGGRLDQRITLEAREQPLSETAEFLRQATGLNVVLAPALVASPPLISLQVREMTLGHVLTWVERIAKVHVGYINGAVYISDQPVAGAQNTRLYDVSDLAMPIRHFPGPMLSIPGPGTGGSLIAPAQVEADETQPYDLDSLAELLNRLIVSK